MSAQDTLTLAVEAYTALRDRQLHPDGAFDKAGRWSPSSTEYQECCRSIRGPSRAYPYSSMVHCRTAVHVAQRFGVEASSIRRGARA